MEGLWVSLMVLLAGAAVWLAMGVRRFLRPDGLAVFVSGCDSGIGQQLAVLLSRMGCLVFAGCLDPGTAKSSLPSTVRVVRLDITDPDSVRAAVDAVQDALEAEKKELWALVNNAGVCVYGRFEWLTEEQRLRQVQVNLLGTMRLTKACLPMLKASRGRIINVTSVNGLIAYPGLTAYAATKFALEGFSDALRMELGHRHGIRVITVRPGDYARVTALMHRHRHHMKEMWLAMSPGEQEREGARFEKYHAQVLDTFGLTSPTSWEGAPVLRDLQEAVLAKNPADKYLSATLGMKLAYKIMLLVPHRWLDGLLAKAERRMLEG